uniref:Uncharacterized protein n=1 Tax=Triticum urartu TaxID=4572 RepID=A0A8R7V9C1_TRIUA
METPNSTYTDDDFRHKAESYHVALAFEVPGDWLQERDATIMTIIQVVWAAADAGLSLADVAAEAKHASEAVGTMGVALLV